MPNRENVLRRAQSVPCASVLPTKQAIIVSTDEVPSATIPTLQARKEPTYEWVKLTRKAIMRREYSQEPELFLVEMRITSELRISPHNVKEVVYERLFEEYHPYLAIGKAIVEHAMQVIAPRMESITIYRRVKKKK